MFVIGNFFRAIAAVLDIALTLYMWVVIVRAVLSWVNPDPYNPVVRFIHQVTEPVLREVRKRLPVTASNIDFSPLVVILAIFFVNQFLVKSLYTFAAKIAG